MNKTAIKNFAIWARVRLIEQVTQLAYEYDVIDGVELDENQDSLGGDSLPEEVFRQRRELVLRIKTNGFQNTMEEVAYTWFNRFMALRFMEVNGYLPSKVRIFSDDEGRFKPEVLREALTVEIAGLNREHIVEMLDRQENENLYKYLIITQCNELNAAIPALFEKLGGWTELLFPRNLLQEDSVLQHLVEDIPEADWQDQVQIIGWLYQYYNTEPKDKVFADMKKNIKISKESIPAATQLFTPDWIVRYMVQNSLGRLYSGQCVANSGKQEQELAQEFGWKYYLPECEQNSNLPTTNFTLDTVKFLDPCMGSGHILVYAFDVLMQMYTAAGWAERDAAREIVAKNLYGLDLDKRAYQLAYFSIVMKARQYDRRYLRRCAEDAAARPNLSYFQDMPDVDSLRLSGKLGQFVAQFRHADVFGSLISVQPVAGLDGEIDAFSGEIGLTKADMQHLLELNRILSQQYDIVCTNPPYMGGSGMNPVLSEFVKKKFPDYKSDLFSVFMIRCMQLCKPEGYLGFLTPYVWMFIKSYEALRNTIYANKTIETLIQFEYSAFEEATVPICTFALKNCRENKKGTYLRLTEFRGGMEVQRQKALEAIENPDCDYRYTALQSNFSKIPGSPVAYWVGEKVFDIFDSSDDLYSFAPTKMGLTTGDNGKFLRLWYEIESKKNGLKFHFYNKGGEYRRWYGNISYVIDWENNGFRVRNFKGSTIRNDEYYFRKCISWGLITSSKSSFRSTGEYTCVFGDAGPGCFPVEEKFYYVLAFLNCKVTDFFLSFMNPTLNLSSGITAKIPFRYKKDDLSKVHGCSLENEKLSKEDWDSFEVSWNFKRHPLV